MLPHDGMQKALDGCFSASWRRQRSEPCQCIVLDSVWFCGCRYMKAGLQRIFLLRSMREQLSAYCPLVQKSVSLQAKPADML